MGSDSSNVYKIIVGVDYGTTFTGVSYAPTTGKSVSDINVIQAWPGPSREQDENWKTPSRIAYSRENSNMSSIQWGYQVTPRMTSYAWTKLLLDAPPHGLLANDDMRETEGDGLLRLPPFKASATEVCTDYLREIYNYTISILEKRITAEILRVTPLEFWFTVPAIWSDKAKSETHRAAREAGFGSRPKDRINMILEPEAAAIATLSSLSSGSQGFELRIGDGILICDCGGGTVDIVTYKITSLKPRLEFEELLEGTGAKCGSTFIDREFHRWMSRTFGSAFTDTKFEKRGPGSRFMRDFESHKRDFGATADPQRFEVELVMPKARDSEHYDSEDSLVIFGNSEMTSFFNPVVTRIKALIEGQFRQVKQKSIDSRINTVILAGGFGDSPYLNKELRAWCASKRNITFLCPEHPQASIVKGAALRGLQDIKPQFRRSRLHYGVSIGQPFRKGIDPDEDMYIEEWTKSKYCHNKMMWHIHKGDLVTDKTCMSHGVFSVHHQGSNLTRTLKLMACDRESAPDRYSAQTCRQIGTIHCAFSESDLSRFKTKKRSGIRIWYMEYTIEVQMGAEVGMLRFRCLTNGAEIGTADIKYE